jgi:DNA-binding transcriptional regulator YiaG
MKKTKAKPDGMTGAQFDAALKKLDMTQMGFSRFIGVGGRTVRSWIGDEFPVPKTVALLVNLMVKTKTNPEDMKA